MLAPAGGGVANAPITSMTKDNDWKSNLVIVPHPNSANVGGGPARVPARPGIRGLVLRDGLGARADVGDIRIFAVFGPLDGGTLTLGFLFGLALLLGLGGEFLLTFGERVLSV